MFMANYSRGSVVLVRFPFSDLAGAKVRPAINISTPHQSQDLFIVPLTSKIQRLQPGEFVMQDWQAAGLNVATAVKRGIFTIHQDLIITKVGSISSADADELEGSLRAWLGL
jgi:mRNA interferase MazF